MRMWRVVILVNLALAVGLGFGYGAWGRRLATLDGEVQDGASAVGAAQARARGMLCRSPRR